MMCVFESVWIVFFFQAEDGIRDLVRSRGLGDVYKRQGYHLSRCPKFRGRLYSWKKSTCLVMLMLGSLHESAQNDESPAPVSYTHLTLPTSDLV
mgnify:CR=1 FL=1